MHKQYRLIILAIVALVAAGLAYLFFTRPAETPSPPSATDQVKQVPVRPETSTPARGGTYTEYSAEKVAASTDTELLFFHAPWCPQCHMLDSSITTMGVPEGVTIFKVDYDSSQTLRQKYGVTLQTTVVKIDNNGDKVASFVAYSEPSLEAVEQALLR